MAGPTSSVTSTATTNVAYDRSCEKTAQTQAAMDSCAASALKQLQGQLVEALATERKVVDTGLVDAAQAAFEQYQAAECAASASPNKGGSIYPLLVANCQVTLTVQRIEQVRSDTTQASEGLDHSP